jgi:hypothetical protein
MPPSVATRHEPRPLGVDAIPTMGAFSANAPIEPVGIDCSPTTLAEWATAVRGCAVAFAVEAERVEPALAPATLRAVAIPVTVTRTIAQ